MKSTKRLVLLAVLVSQALILSLVESWLPIPQVVPGVKLGLANIITLVVLVFLGFRDALLVVVVRCTLASVFGAGFIAFLFSISGGILSTIVMAVLHKKCSRYFSILGVSIAGAVTHNIGQLTAAVFVMKEPAVMSYLPVLLVVGVIMGCFVGLCSSLLIDAMRKTDFFVKERGS